MVPNAISMMLLTSVLAGVVFLSMRKYLKLSSSEKE